MRKTGRYGRYQPAVQRAVGFDGTLTRGLRKDGRSPLAALPAGSEELWIIARGGGDTVAPSEEAPGSGALMAKIEEKEVPMPLKHTDVHATVSGYIGAVEVTQQFQNPYSSKIEAVYVFPLPHNAAVNEFIMTIGERRIRGIIRERQEAEQIYQEAKRQGYVASLLTQERPNIFTQSVANIEPGKEIDVNIKYFHTLDYVDGWYEFVFPMVVGPRFNPPGLTNGIGAVARGQSRRLRPEHRSPVSPPRRAHRPRHLAEGGGGRRRGHRGIRVQDPRRSPRRPLRRSG